MTNKTYSPPIEKASNQTRLLSQQAEQLLTQPQTLTPEQTALLLEILTQLNTAVEELQVADEELREQSAELIEKNHQINMERLRYRELFDLAPDGYLVTDIFGAIQEANEIASELLGVSAQWLINKPLVNFVPEAERSAFRLQVNKLQQTTHIQTWEGHLRPRAPEQVTPPIYVEFTVNLARDPIGNVLGLRWFIRDISVRKQAEADLQRSRTELKTLTSRLHTAREEERLHIAREIHDQLGGNLTALKMDLIWLGKHLPPDTPDLTERTSLVTRTIDENIQIVRHLAGELRPSVLDDLGLVAALDWHLNELKTRTNLNYQFNSEFDDTKFDSERATAVFRLFQEALTNVTRHAYATQVNVHLWQIANTLQLEIADNGVGITPEATQNPTAWGLIGMRERASLFNGTIKFEGSHGQGTIVHITMPLA